MKTAVEMATTRLANAGRIDVVDARKIVDEAVTTFNLKGVDLLKFADLLIAGAEKPPGCTLSAFS